MSHGQSESSASELDDDFVQVVADTMQALATPSRLRILGRLQAGPLTRVIAGARLRAA